MQNSEDVEFEVDMVGADKEDEEDTEPYDDGSLNAALVVLNWNDKALEASKKQKEPLVQFLRDSGGIAVKQSDNMFVFGSEDQVFEVMREMIIQFPWTISTTCGHVAKPMIVLAPTAGRFEYVDFSLGEIPTISNTP